MEASSLNQFIKKALDHYDKQQIKYNDLIRSSKINYYLDKNEIEFIDNDGKILDFPFETLGYFDNNTQIWIWGWLLQDLKSEQVEICRELLNYGLKLEPDTLTAEHNLFKALLVNSRISIDEDTQLDINLAIISYLMRNRFKFIYPRKLYINDSKNKFVTFYLLIK